MGLRGRGISAFVVTLALGCAPSFSAPPSTIGITPDTITLGLHGPLTGAGIRGESLVVGKDLYWRYGDGGGPVRIAGREVNVLFANDENNPSVATRECKKLGSEVFLIAGVIEADLMAACARHADMNGIPYVSTGGVEQGLRANSTFFAASMSYTQQVPLVVRYIKGDLGVSDPTRVAAVITNSASHDEIAAAFADAVPGATIYRPSRTERGSSMVSNLCIGSVSRFDAVFPLTSALYFLEMAGSAPCRPQYVGVGLTMGLDEIASLACSNGAAGDRSGGLSDVPIVGPLLFPSNPNGGTPRFFSPAPAFEDSDAYDPAFRAAAAAAGVEPDDQMWLLWGLSKTLHAMLSAPRRLDRRAFIDAVEELSASTGVFPDVAYTPADHFGARQAHLLKMVCQERGAHQGYFVTEKAFVSTS